MEMENLSADVSIESVDVTFELGRLLAERGDFGEAIPELLRAAKLFIEADRGREYLECQNLLLKIYAESDDSRGDDIKDEIQDLVLKGRLTLDAKTFYSLAFCASHRGRQEEAFGDLQKALALAVETGNREDLAYAIFGLASVYSRLGKFEESQAELRKLETILETVSLPNVMVSSLMQRAQLALTQQQYDEALEFCWKAQEALRDTKNAVTGVYLIAMLGTIYLEKGELASARIHISLASRMADGANYRRLSHYIKVSEARLASMREQPFDLKLDLENQMVHERKLGPVDLRNQHVLVELLRLFSGTPGKVFTKEDLVEQVWRQSYDPGLHDNKVYVTIKRLRKFIEPDGDQPRYIIRAKDGYYLNTSARLVFEKRTQEEQ